jgi:phosphomevalonate kinase
MSSSAHRADRPSASAPGKILLAGEYAVLDGAPAVVMAVSRRAIARVADAAQALSPFLAAVRDRVPDRDTASRIVVDTSALHGAGGVKLGLGSSAAATVAATACALGTDDAASVHAIAHAAHAAAQEPRGSRGSGADIAAAVHGGVLVVRKQADGEPLAVTRRQLPADLVWLAVWTGAPADTASLVAKIRALDDARPQAYAAACTRIADTAARLVDALAAGSAEPAVEALRAGGQAVAALGREAGAALWTDAHDRLRAAVEPLGGAVKPTGAGGGDVALCAVAADAAALRAAVAALGMTVLDVRVDPVGVRLEG